VTPPAGAAAWIAIVYEYTFPTVSGTTLIPPTGWSEVDEFVIAAYGTRLHVFRSTSSTPGTVWTYGTVSGTDPVALVVAIVGYDTDMSSVSVARAEDTQTSPAATATGEALVLRAITDGANATSGTVTYPTGATLGQFQQWTSNLGGWRAVVAVAHQNQASAGSTGTATWTVPSEDYAIAYTILLYGEQSAPSGSSSGAFSLTGSASGVAPESGVPTGSAGGGFAFAGVAAGATPQSVHAPGLTFALALPAPRVEQVTVVSGGDPLTFRLQLGVPTVATGSTVPSGSADGGFSFSGSSHAAAVPRLGAASGGLALSGSASGSASSGGRASGGVAWVGSASAAASPRSGGAAGALVFTSEATGAAPLPQGSASGALSFVGSATGEAPAAAVSGQAYGVAAWTGAAIGARASLGRSAGRVRLEGSTRAHAPRPLRKVFTPPTRPERRSTHPLFGKISTPQGLSVLKGYDGLYRQVEGPLDEDVAAAEITYLGGYRYPIDETERLALVAAGYGEFITEERL